MYNTCYHFCVYCYANISKEAVLKNKDNDESESITDISFSFHGNRGNTMGKPRRVRTRKKKSETNNKDERIWIRN